MPEQDENDGAEAEEDDSVDSFLRAAAHLPEDSAAGPVSAKRIEHGLHEGLLVAKRYRLERLLGEGGMGIVWAATHTVTGRSSALKFLKGSTRIQADLRHRFLREARAATAIGHPNVVDVHDVFDVGDGTLMMVMDLLSGETLGMRLERERRLSMEQTASLLIPVISAVGTAHALGIVHRDLKPENVFLVRDTAAGERVKVLDFGVAKFADGAAELHESGMSTGTGAVLGTARYMAPEQALGEKDVDHRADVWALGIILYECLSGQRPIKASSAGQAVLQMMGAGVEPLGRLVPSLPLDVTTVVTRMLAKDRASRPESLHEVSDVLARYTGVRAPPFGVPLYAGQAVPEAFSPTVSSGVAPRMRPRTRTRALVSAAILASVGLSSFVLFRARPLDSTRSGLAPAGSFSGSGAASTPPSVRPVDLSLSGPAPSVASTAPVLAKVKLAPANGAAAPLSIAGAVARRPAKDGAAGPAPASVTTAMPAKISAAAPARRGLADRVPF